MKWQDNPAYLGKRHRGLPNSKGGWVLWTLLVVGGTILIGLTSGLVASAVVPVVCTALYGGLWLRERRHT